MKTTSKVASSLIAAVILALGMISTAAAHCDTLDGPVVQDARKALDTRNVTPVLKWVRQADEKAVKAAFDKALAAQGKKQQQGSERKFFETLVRIHRAGEGAPYTRLKPAGQVEPVIAAADKALTDGSPEAVMRLVNETVSHGIRQRYEKVAEALKSKDESVAKGRAYVAAYVEYTHYLERVQMAAEGEGAHHGEADHKEHAAPKKSHGH